jgi:hypothetical protein
VPAKQVNQYDGYENVEHIITGRESAFGEQWKYENLKGIGRNSQYHGGPKTGAWRDGEFVLRDCLNWFHIGLF